VRSRFTISNAQDAERQLRARWRTPIRSRTNRRRWASSRRALLVRIGRIVLELVVKADVVHLFEHVVAVGLDGYSAAASAADRRVAHERILPALERFFAPSAPVPKMQEGVDAGSRRSTFIRHRSPEETNMPDVQTAYEPPRIEKCTTIELMLIGVASGFLIGK
jgi:hypothetical protein